MTDLPPTAVCLNCRYSLRGLVDARCPECGRPFDPSNSATFGDASELHWIDRLATPPPRWHRRLAAITAAILLLDFSSPGYVIPHGLILQVPFIFLGLAVVTLVAVDYPPRLFARAWRAARGTGRVYCDVGLKARKRYWYTTPICCILVATAFWYPWPVWVRFQLSRAAFERVAANGETADRYGYQIIGLNLVGAVKRYDNGTVFFETGYEFLSQQGIMYRPVDQSIPCVELYAKHRLADRWYTALLDW